MENCEKTIFAKTQTKFRIQQGASKSIVLKDAIAERPAQGKGDTSHGAVCVPESHCQASHQQHCNVTAAILHVAQLLEQVHDHAHAVWPPTEPPTFVAHVAAQGLLRRHHVHPQCMWVSADVIASATRAHLDNGSY